MEISGTIKGDLDIKRCYLPGLMMVSYCPHCGTTYRFDGDVEYIGYPEVGSPFDFSMYCRECCHEWTKKLQIIMRVVEV